MEIRGDRAAGGVDRSWGFSEGYLGAPGTEDVILVVDDDPTCCRMLAHLLDRAGHAVEWTTDPCFALERIFKRPYALVISDVNMPGVRGTELVARMTRLRPDLPALLVSARVDDALRRQARALGAELLAKPFGTDALLAAVRAATATRRGEEGVAGNGRR